MDKSIIMINVMHFVLRYIYIYMYNVILIVDVQEPLC